jgi:hypothetical protein
METIYKVIPRHPNYRAGSDGSIWSTHHRWGARQSWRQLKPGTIRSGPHYKRLVVALGRGRQNFRYVHHCVLEAFVGEQPEGTEACHEDGNASNNKIENLYWGTKKQNGLDARRHGRRKGERHTLAKLTDDLVRVIRTRIADGETQQSVADSLGIQRRNVGRVANGTRWGHVP